MLVTFGSGLQKLHQLEDPGLYVSTSCYLCIMAASFFCVTLAEGLGILRLPPGAGYLLGFHVALAGFFFAISIGSALREERTEIREWAKQFSRSGAHWVDLFASSDPVPNGPLFLDPELSVESIEVTNEGSVLRDHITYRSNLDEFYADLVQIIGEYGGTQIPLGRLTPLDELALVQAKKLHRLRSIAKRIDVDALFLSLILILLNPHLLISLGRKIANFANDRLCSVLDSTYQGFVGKPCWTVSPLLSGTITAVIGWIALGFVVEFFFYLRASQQEEALYERATAVSSLTSMMPSLVTFSAHVVSSVALVLALQSYSTRVYGWVAALGAMIKTGHSVFYQGYIIGLVLGFLINTAEIFKLRSIEKNRAKTLQEITPQ